MIFCQSFNRDVLFRALRLFSPTTVSCCTDYTPIKALFVSTLCHNSLNAIASLRFFNLSGFVLSFLSCGVEREVAGLLVKFVLHRKWQHPHYSGEIWKRSFGRLVKPTAVHTNSDRKRGLSKTLFKPQEFEKADFSCSYGRKALWKRLFAAKTMTSW